MGLDAVELLIAVEEKFGIQISDAEAEIIETPRMLIDAVQAKTNKPRAEITQSIRTIVIETLGIKGSKYFEDAHFIRDLGMN